MSIGEILFSFKGRISRGAFWAAIIPMFIVSIVLQVAMVLAAEQGGDPAGFIIMAIIVGGFMVWISLAIYTKRWHDLDKSGWMNLTLLLPILNFFILLFLGLAAGTADSNKYGEVPGKTAEE